MAHMDDNPNYDDTSSLCDDSGIDYEYDLDYDIQTPSMTLLNWTDYSLNSPLIYDEIDDFLSYLKNNNHNIDRWDKKAFSNRLHAFSDAIHPMDILDQKMFYYTMYRFPWVNHIDCTNFDILLQKIGSDSLSTEKIVHAFIKGVFDLEYPSINKSNIPQEMKKWGQLFLEMYWMVLLLNATNEEELKELDETLTNVAIMSNGARIGTKMKSVNFGDIIVSDGFLLLINHNCILDRNTVLMFKDLYIARFQTLISMVNRHDQKFCFTDWQTLEGIYQLGDELLALNGVPGFDSIKMIEPICNLKLTKMVRINRPLIPEFPNFGDYLVPKVQKLGLQHPQIKRIFEIIMNLENVELVLTVYGSFRHWGHPYIDYLEGLQSLYEQTTMPKEIDEEYAGKLASDLAFIVLRNRFFEEKKWYVDISLLPVNNPLYQVIKTNIWPTSKKIMDFGDHWHELPLLPCFKIPAMIPTATLYSDKSHSLNRQEVLQAVSGGCTRIPSKKVLVTLLEKPSRDWPAFLSQIDREGIPLDSLIIGLKGKEREVKIKGRFFSLMSWDLRDYFVITEYLIKIHFVPLLRGLTMADDMTTVIKKMLDNTSGQGTNSYDHITIANHLDYEKWNNHQRKKATGPVFRVMGQFLGYPRLIERTHEFFEQSLIYYNDRPDLMMRKGPNSLQNKTSIRVCWEGQEGGLEGLRQKGWSILNLLVIRREGSESNTQIKTLAQGDNQVICTHYRLRQCVNNDEISEQITNVINNNSNILRRISEGTRKLGLIINQDETMQSCDYLNYSKVPLLWGNIFCLESKKWSRVTCSNNNQVPCMSDIMSSVTSSALAVSHFSESPINSMFHYNYLGNFANNIIQLHNPALRCPPSKLIKKNDLLDTPNFKIILLYLDPSLGGICGMSLTRFLIRMFPDPITEGLTFLKIIYSNTKDKQLQQLMVNLGNPRLVSPNLQNFTKLIEDPLSINLPRGLSASTMLQNEIKKRLWEYGRNINNSQIRDAIQYQRTEESRFLNFLSKIRPIFPRFISQYKESTFLGITDGLVSLFQNSRTMRTKFMKQLAKRLDTIILKSEIISYSSILRASKPLNLGRIWDCSASQADRLRQQSWGNPIIGATVPHPAEMISSWESLESYCQGCKLEFPQSLYVSVLIPNGLANCTRTRGPHPAYLGSKTSETTSILRPWEREAKIPLIKKAAQLRSSIGWFVEPNSALARSIYSNLYSLTGEDWGSMNAGYKRTGSALHRFTCSRQSSSGYTAQSPVRLTRIISTTSTMQEIGDKNYDFMFQATLLFAQMVVSEAHYLNPNPGLYHFHVSCEGCMREIQEPTLDVDMEYEHPMAYNKINSWKPESADWSQKILPVAVEPGEWDSEHSQSKCFFIGLIEGFLFGESIYSKDTQHDISSLFPLTFRNRLDPEKYSAGLIDGLVRASALSVVFRRAVSDLKKPDSALIGSVIYLIDEISKNINLLNLWREEPFALTFTSIRHRTPPSYPLTTSDLGVLGRNYLQHMLLQKVQLWKVFQLRPIDVWIFSDVNQTSLIGLLAASSSLVSLIYRTSLSSKEVSELRSVKNHVTMIRSNPENMTVFPFPDTVKRFRSTSSEVRHAAKSINKTTINLGIWNRPEHLAKWGTEAYFPIRSYTVSFNSNPNPTTTAPAIQSCYKGPLISGLRLFQCATGSHYKMRSILSGLNIRYHDVLSGGDGSGGIGSMILRYNLGSRLIFNSLMRFDNVSLRGSNPAPPSAILSLPLISSRCVNLRDAWRNPSDLSQQSTWDYFLNLKHDHHMKLNLGIFDMEVTDRSISRSIELRIRDNLDSLFEPSVTIIYKTYVDILLTQSDNVIGCLGPLFSKTEVVYTEVTSTGSQEAYIVFQNKRSSQILAKFYDNATLINACIQAKCFKTDIQEYERAIRLKQFNFLSGIPTHFLIDITLEFTTCLKMLGLPSGIAYTVTRWVQNHPRLHEISCLTLYVVVMNHIVDTTSLYETKPIPPSDNTVVNLGSWMIGFWMWYSYQFEDYPIYINSHRMFNTRFPFSWSVVKVGDKFTQQWNLKNSYPVKKFFRLTSKHAIIAQIVRLLSQLYPRRLSRTPWSQLSEHTIEFNKNLTHDHIFYHTDYFDSIVKGDIFYADGGIKVMGTSRDVHSSDGAYVS